MGELCFGLEEGTTWAVFRDREGGLCGTPVTSQGTFREVVVDLQRSLADGDLDGDDTEADSGESR